MYRSFCLLILGLLFTWLPVQAQQLAFPTAEGFGRFATGGRGGKVYNINNLGAGVGSGGSCNAGGCSGGTITFRDCLMDRFAVGARTCIFRTGGIIDWPCESCGAIPSVPPYLTIAGQTAPGNGIMLKSFQLQARNTHDMIVRHLRVRPSESVPNPGTAGGIEIFGPVTPTYNVIIDHYSTGWACDDTIGGGYQSYNVTYQWGIVSEGIFPPGCDVSKVGIWVTYSGLPQPGNVSFLHNYWANHNYRAVLFGTGNGQLVNNVLYNIAVRGMYLYPHGNYDSPASPARAEMVNNYFKPGPNSVGNYPRIQTIGVGDQGVTNITGSILYVSGNIHPVLRPNDTYPQTSLVEETGNPHIAISGTPLGYPTIPTQTSATQAVTDVLARAGATVPVRDSIDQRSINDFNAGTGRLDAANVGVYGGYPTYPAGTPYVDTDGDGISDTWESSHGLNPNNAADGPAIATNGYSNLENFLNELAGDSLTPPTSFSVAITPTTVQANDTITVSWTAPAGQTFPLDWVGLFRVADPDTAYDPTRWVYTNGATSGSVQWLAPAAGSYNARYLVNDSFNSIATSNTLTVSSLPPAPSKIWLTFEECTGTVLIDETKNGNTGDLLTSPTIPTFTPGRLGRCGLHFNGQDDTVRLNMGTPVPTGVTVAFSLKADDAIDGTVTTYPVYLSYDPTNKMSFGWNDTNASFRQAFSVVRNGSYIPCKYTSTLALGIWYRLLMTYDGTTLRTYRNGNLECTTTAAPPVGSLSGAWLNPPVAATDGSVSWRGLLDEFIIDDHVYSQTEINSDFNRNFNPPLIGPRGR